MGVISLPANPGLQSLTRLLGGRDGETRLVGGVVRDRLAGVAVKDVDLATRHRPDEVMRRLEEAGIKAVPTGLAHGTVTAVLDSGPVEVTTLRRDVATDGRRARIAFTDDWREDAARRDFTINALYADPESGEVFDYFGGEADLAAGIVRFIGDPLQRIAEDHLRIMRFFRFHARFGRGAPHAASLRACSLRANDLMALSRERIADELLKLLALPEPAETLVMMRDARILAPVLPEVDDLTILSALGPAGQGDGVLRLAAALPADPDLAEAIANRLRLSKAKTKRLRLAAGRRAADADAPMALAYRLGKDAAIDRLRLLGREDALATIADWSVPVLPLSGGAVVAQGVQEGPQVALVLRRVEERWIAEGFPDAARVAAILQEIVAETLS